MTSCALEQPAPPADVLEEALPETTEVRDEFSTPADTGEVDDGWVADFGDAKLDELVVEVIANNLNLEAAAAQVDIAAARATQAGASLKPAVGLSAAGQSADAGLPNQLESSNVFLNVSWEIDVWGRVRAGAAAADAAFRATEADYQFARQSLVAQLSKAWFLATQVRLQMELAQEAVDIYAETGKLVETRDRVGKAQAQDLPLAKANLAVAEANLRQVESAYEEILRSIEVVLGRYPSGELETASELVAVPPPIPVGLPAELLERRPDLIASERRVAATFFGSQQARAARLPRISLTAAAGAVDSDLANLLGVGDPVVNLGANLFAPLYTGGALQAGVEAADAQQRAAMSLYAQDVLQAFQEVETALNNEGLFREREAYVQSAVDEGQEAHRITKAQYEVGRVDLLSLLQVQARLLSAKSALIAAKNERLAERVNLHLALGGSFEERAE